MLRQKPKQLSLHSILYNKIPENHILKRIYPVLDFSFINKMLEDSYCKHFGRPAKEPELMCRLLILKHLYNLSDENLCEEANLNLAQLYFLNLNPEDELPDPSLLSKFRVHRLQDVSLDYIITEIVRQCVEQGIIKGEEISIDATHVEANTKKKIAERLMKQIAKKIIKTYNEENEEELEVSECPDYEIYEDHTEAKMVMKEYLEEVIKEAENKITTESDKTKKVINNAKEILEDPKFIVQRGCRSIVDVDARVGRKSKEESFYGYKAEYIMTTEERIITSVNVADGAYTDGNEIEKLLENTMKSGIKIKEVYGDKAYFRKPILSKIEEIEAKAYIPVSEVVYRIDESNYTYNKDSDEWICSEGNRTVEKKRYKSKAKSCKGGYREGYKYYFEMSQCKICPKHDECAKKSARKILNLGLNTTEFYEISQYQKEEEFKEKYKKRATIEAKNAEIKRFHGLNRAIGYGLLSMSKQAKLTAIAVNIKRIAAIISSKFTVFIEKNLFLKYKVS